MFNLRNKACQEAFKDATDDNPELLRCFDNELPLEVQSNRWYKCFNSVLHKCFRKVRIVNNMKKGNIKMNNLFDEKIKMRKQLKPVNITEEMRKQIQERIIKIEEKMEKEGR